MALADEKPLGIDKLSKCSLDKKDIEIDHIIRSDALAILRGNAA